MWRNILKDEKMEHDAPFSSLSRETKIREGLRLFGSGFRKLLEIFIGGKEFTGKFVGFFEVESEFARIVDSVFFNPFPVLRKMVRLFHACNVGALRL